MRASRQELEGSRARYFDLYDLAPVGYFTLSQAGFILEVNLTAATLLGLERGALVQRPLSRFILQEDRRIYYQYHKLLNAGQPGACELRMMKEGGGVFWAQLAAVKAEGEGSTVTRLVMSDISDQKRAEEDRAARNSLLDALMETLPVGLALMDAQGATIRANPEFERIWGGPPRMGTPFSNRSSTVAVGRHPASRSRLKSGLRRAL